MKPTAVLSLDIEDWYHLDYFDRRKCDISSSLLDGVEVFSEFLAARRILSTCFVLGELAGALGPTLRALAEAGHDISSHGWDHRRPLTLSPEAFRLDVLRSREALSAETGRPVPGYRAPCFSLDRARLDVVADLGFDYDSSRIEFGEHPLYGTINLRGFEQAAPGVFRRGRFAEFEVSTLRIFRRQIPVSGGGYIRLVPWVLMRRWIHRFLDGGALYVLYIHPFELSLRATPRVPNGTSHLTRFRFAHGRARVRDRLEALVDLLGERGYRFTTFAGLHRELLAGRGSGGDRAV